MAEQTKKQNPMKEIKIEKIVLSVGATGEDLEKGVKLLKLLSNQKPKKVKTRKRIASLDVRPGLEVGALVTIRKNPEEILRRLLSTTDNILKRKQVSENTFSFGVKEYIEIPGIEYQRDIGIIGLDVTVTFSRAGRRTELKKIKRGKVPKRHKITAQEIIKFMKDNFGTSFI